MARTSPTTALSAAALGLLLALTACGSDDGGPDGTAAAPVSRGVTSPAPSTPPTTAPTATPTAIPTAATPTPAGLADGRHEVHVLAATDGSLVLDRGRFVVGEPVEPGVDSTAPITFDTGAAQERQTAPVADDARLVLQVSGTGATEVGYDDVAAAVEASSSAFLATVEVAGGEVVALEELYRA